VIIALFSIQEWSQVNELAQDCKNSDEMMQHTLRLSTWSIRPQDHERVEMLRAILKELETKI
jgi:hypothetical protein